MSYSLLETPKPDRINIGERGEALAADFLAENGFRIIIANFKVPVGRNSRGAQVTGEIDLIALEGDTLCFIEVKTRRTDEFAPILANVDLRKQRQIIRTARVYRRVFDIRNTPYRYDVITVLIPKFSDTQIEVIRGFWNESKFNKKRHWSELWTDVF